MSLVNILNIQVLDNPTNFKNPFQFEITFECNAPLKDGNGFLFFTHTCVGNTSLSLISILNK